MCAKCNVQVRFSAISGFNITKIILSVNRHKIIQYSKEEVLRIKMVVFYLMFELSKREEIIR